MRKRRPPANVVPFSRDTNIAQILEAVRQVASGRSRGFFIVACKKMDVNASVLTNYSDMEIAAVIETALGGVFPGLGLQAAVTRKIMQRWQRHENPGPPRGRR